MTTFTPGDVAARDRIRESVDETLFVEAGAGTGKTTSLVARVMTLLKSGRTTLDRVAVITFTEAAAAELRDRIRDELEAAAESDLSDSDERGRFEAAIEDLDQAAIGTLHSFAASLLFERPLEAGLPPTFEVMDQIAADLEFEDIWRTWVESALNGNEDIPTLPLALTLGLTPDGLREVALQFHRNYDLLDDAILEDVAAPSASIVQQLVDALPELERLCEYSTLGEEDHLFDHVLRLLVSIRRLAAMGRDSLPAYRLLDRMIPISTSRGRQPDWGNDPKSGENACKCLKDMLYELNEQAKEELVGVRMYALMPVLRAVKELVLRYAQDRKRGGRAGFHDLLVWARDLLREDIAVRDHFRQRFSHLLIDEVQDTDPLQSEIAMFLAEATSSGNRPHGWEDIIPEVGKLFVVGDPKQSIYRFRRADVQQVYKLRGLMGGETVELVQNFRSQRPVVDWVNRLFGQWMRPDNEQADYAPLEHRWNAEVEHPALPAVWSLGGALEESNVGPVRQREAKAIAAVLAEVVGGDWQVLDKEATEDAGEERYRSARFSDICLLMPTRTGLRPIEIALDEAGIPYRLEGASLIFETQEVRDLLNCLRAVDDPSDQVATVAALRSPAFACSDVDLLRFHEGGGRFNYLFEGDGPDGPVTASLAVLRRYHDMRTWEPVASLIERLIRDRRLMEAAVDHPRTRELWRRYRFIVESSRAFVDAGGNSLRDFLTWVERQADERARVTESPVPEGDEEAVRVMTVHGAKGLEFPVVVLAGLNTQRSFRGRSVLFDRESGAVEVSIGRSDSKFETAGYASLATAESRMDNAEFVRLLYVATTRARDHLVLSTFRTAKDGTTAAARIAGYMDGEDDLWKQLPDLAPATPPPTPRPDKDDIPDDHTMAARERWLVRREAVLKQRGRPTSVSATALAGIAKEDPADTVIEVDEPWKRGRGGAPLGRAVHSVLQTIDLETARGIDETSRAQAAAEGIPERHAEVASLTRVAVASDAVRRAVALGRLWREVPTSVPVGDGVMHGYIDLLFEEAGELVVVDYKTDAIDAAESEEAAQRYRLQAGSYALMIQRSTGRPVKEVVFLFLRPRREQALTDVSSLAEEAELAAVTYLGHATTAE